jgi:3'-phosphoadenosine 5'-phosphosulfate sulfotransferase (PAPS reductase)/FAD synthetase
MVRSAGVSAGRAIRDRDEYDGTPALGAKVIIHTVSTSGGADSAATLQLAIQKFGKHRVLPIFADTGNEHETTLEYLDYLQDFIGIPIVRLRGDFSDEIRAKRMFIARDRRTKREYGTAPVFNENGVAVPKRDGYRTIVFQKPKPGQDPMTVQPIQKTKKVGGGRKVRWTNKAKRRALDVLRPTGNPFLDLCLWKGRFPSRKAQFCTERLKRDVIVSYQLDLLDAGHTVISWQGVRRDESHNRRNALKFEGLAPRFYAYRPLVDWSKDQVFAYCASFGMKPNPLYLQGMNRVGCMPCINAQKDEVRQISVRFPQHIDRIEEWERLVSQASKRGWSTFFHLVGDTAGPDREIFSRCKVRATVEWSKTSRGGRHFDMFAEVIDTLACESKYAKLCE